MPKVFVFKDLWIDPVARTWVWLPPGLNPCRRRSGELAVCLSSSVPNLYLLRPIAAKWFQLNVWRNLLTLSRRRIKIKQHSQREPVTWVWKGSAALFSLSFLHFVLHLFLSTPSSARHIVGSRSLCSECAMVVVPRLVRVRLESGDGLLLPC